MILDAAPEIIDQDEGDYHADVRRISHSMLEVLHESPRLYHGRFITGEYPFDRSDALDFGKAAHAMALESRRVYVPIPDDVLATNGARSTKAYREFAAKHNGKVLFKTEHIETLENMVAELRRHPIAKDIIEAPAKRECVIHWADYETGLPMKCRIDVLRDGFTWAADMKTARSCKPRLFAKTAYDLGYHRQAALYRRAVEAITHTAPSFYFVPMLKEPPYTVEVYELSDVFLDLGEMENRRLIDDLSRRMDENDWDDDRYGEIKTLSPPMWAIRDAFNERTD